jgi:hypothetical protein
MTQYPAIVVSGHQVASGIAQDSPFFDGTIALQKPFFKALGLDLSDCFNGTLNLALSAKTIKVLHWHYQFKQVRWSELVPAENFNFLRCQLRFGEQLVAALIYQPAAETKIAHLQAPNVVELLAPKISGLSYGAKVQLLVEPNSLRLSN